MIAEFKDLLDPRAVVLLERAKNREIERLEYVGGVWWKKKEVYVVLEGGKHEAVGRVAAVAVKNQEARLFRGFRGSGWKEDFGEPGIRRIVVSPAVLGGVELLILKYLQIGRKPLLLQTPALEDNEGVEIIANC